MADFTKFALPALGIGCITVLEICALENGINGALFGTALALIGMLAGVSAKQLIDFLRAKKTGE